MPTVALKIFVEDRYQEFLIAELADLDFETFEQDDAHVVAYIPSARWNDVKREEIQLWLAAHAQPTTMREEVLADQNWNRQWEETVAPIAVPPFLVRPTWHETPPQHKDLIVLEIDPKMSFGTGYHESTRLILRLLPSHIQQGDRVLDAGTGTGILAVAAMKVGASTVDAFDMDPWAHQNAVENFYLNRVQDRVRMFEGGIESVPPAAYDLILANINLNVIIGLMNSFNDRLSVGGGLLTSGVLIKDRGRLVDAAAARGLTATDEREEGEWWAAAFRRQR